MQNDHSNALRGLSIATIVVAGLSILVCVLGLIATAVGGAALGSLTPEMFDYYSDYGYYDEYGLDSADYLGLMGLVIGFGVAAIFFELAISIVALLAGIFALRYHAQREKLGMVFGWSLAGAIASLLGGNVVTMVLLIIMTVFAYKDKQLAAAQPLMAAPATAYTIPNAPTAQSAQTAQPVVQPTAATIQPTAQSTQSAQPTAAAQTPAAQPAATLTANETASATTEAKAVPDPNTALDQITPVDPSKEG